MNDSKDVIALQTWWKSCLIRIRQNVQSEEEKRQEKAARRADDLLSDYQSPDHIVDAYGFGLITEKKKDKLLDLWEKRETETAPDNLYLMKLDLINELLQIATDIINGKR